MKDIKEKILEIAEIAKACPENLQPICFETLLKHFLTGFITPTEPKEKERKQAKKEGIAIDASGQDQATSKQEDLKDSDLHLKLKRFMGKEGVTLDHLNNLYFKQGDKILPLFDDLKTTRLAESQIRITLLQALVNAIMTGEFQADVEAVRVECINRKSYDKNNFSNNFRNNKSLFDPPKFEKTTKLLKLSEAGKKELADLIKNLQ
jgi:hypothetical protein